MNLTWDPSGSLGSLSAPCEISEKPQDQMLPLRRNATLLAVVVVFALSLRLREKELVTIFRLGCSRRAIAGFVAAEIVLIAAAYQDALVELIVS